MQFLWPPNRGDYGHARHLLLCIAGGHHRPGFYEEIRRRDFVVTFAMVAHVPLFARLDAASISDLVSILTARTVHTGTVIIRKGGAATPCTSLPVAP